MALLLKQGRLIDPSIQLDQVADIFIEEGKIAAIGNLNQADYPEERLKVVNCEGMIIMPGAIDIHTHLREPGYEYKEDIKSGTRAAVAGGFSAICCMPNTLPVADNRSVIEYINEKSEEAFCKVYSFGAITKGLEGKEIVEMADLIDAGAVCLSDDGRGIQSSGVMRTAMDYAKMFDLRLVAHSEDETLSQGCVHEGKASTILGILGQPSASESIPVMRDIELSKLTGCPLHICHVSARESIEAIRRAKAQGVDVTAEVTPHHLIFSEDDMLEGYNTSYKMNPPLRSLEDKEALRAALVDGTIDAIASDHAPHASHEKDLEFELAAYGTTGLETALSAIYTHLVIPEIISPARFVELFTSGPRKVLRINPLTLTVGSSADLTVFNPDIEYKVESETLVSKSKNNIFIGQTLQGKAHTVIVDGRMRLENGVVYR